MQHIIAAFMTISQLYNTYFYKDCCHYYAMYLAVGKFQIDFRVQKN